MLIKYQRNALLWAFFIFCICAMPSSGFPRIKISSIIGTDKFAHAFVYLILYIMMYLGLRKYNKVKQYIPFDTNWIWAVFACFIFGVIIEILQGNFFNRGMEFLDVVANSFGIFLGVISTRIFFRNKLS